MILKAIATTDTAQSIVRTSRSEYRPIRPFYRVKFNGKDWIKFGDVME